MVGVKIESTHSLFLGTVDSPGSVVVLVKLTGSENYKLHDQWETCNANAHLAWEDLKESFDKVNRVRIWKLHKEITTLMQGTNSVSMYFSKLKELWSEYDVGLNESYDQARRQILMKSVAPTLGQAYAMIIQDESQQVAAAHGTAKTSEKMESLALQASSYMALQKSYGGSNNSEGWRNNGNSEGWRRNANNSDNWRKDQSLVENHVDVASSSKDTGGNHFHKQGHKRSSSSNTAGHIEWQGEGDW
ncbi:hypothetical protein KY289_020256 [Solanum tuberosum]|nr:hypothetical protein KY289_020256 [Solanum tuberosum]